MQIRTDWDLAADMHKPAWGIIYPLVVHGEHPNLHEYDKAVGLDEIVVGEGQEHVDNATAKKKAKVLRRVKREEREDEEAGGRETDPRINQLSAELAAKKKKPRHS